MLHGWRSGNAPSNLVRQAAKVIFEWRGQQRGLYHLVNFVVIGGSCGETRHRKNAKEQAFCSSHIAVH